MTGDISGSLLLSLILGLSFEGKNLIAIQLKIKEFFMKVKTNVFVKLNAAKSLGVKAAVDCRDALV
jgi:hypothetical protein